MASSTVASEDNSVGYEKPRCK